MNCLVKCSKMCLICWPAEPEVRRKLPTSYFYNSILLYLMSVSLNENVMGKKLDICAEPRLKVAYLHKIWSWRQRQSRCQTEK